MRFLFALALTACGTHEAPPEAPPAPARTELPPPPAQPSSSASSSVSTNPELAPAPASGARLDAVEALHRAQAAGMKATLIVPYPVVCPSIPAPIGDPKRLAATGAMAGTLVDADAFLREDMNVPEAVALLGPAVMCNQQDGSAFSEIYLAAKAPGVSYIVLETQDAAWIGLQIHFETPVSVDMTSLKRFGKGELVSAPSDSMEAGGRSFALKDAAFHGQLMFMHRDRADRETAWQIHELIFRRSAAIEELPSSCRAVDDLARIAALALRATAPEPVAFYGPLGGPDTTTGDHIALSAGLPGNNVKAASIEKTTVAKIDRVRSIRFAFARPIVATPSALAAALATRLHVTAPVGVAENSVMRFDLAKLGVIRASFDKGAIETIAIERVAAP